MAALTAAGALSRVHQVAHELLSSRRYWSRDCAWTTADGALICLGRHAYRTPGEHLTADDSRLITRAFGR